MLRGTKSANLGIKWRNYLVQVYMGIVMEALHGTRFYWLVYLELTFNHIVRTREAIKMATLLSTRRRRIHIWTLYAGRIYQTLGKNFLFLTSGRIPDDHYILFSNGLRHCGMNYEECNAQIHMYVDFIGSDRMPALVYNTEVSN